MITAKELRERAWAKLGEGNWLKAVGAFGLFWLMGTVVAQVVARVGVATGGIENMSFLDFMQKYGAMFGQMGVDVPSDMPAQLKEISFPVTQPWYQVVQYVVNTFAQGVFTPFGITVDDDCAAIRTGGIGSTDKNKEKSF